MPHFAGNLSIPLIYRCRFSNPPPSHGTSHKTPCGHGFRNNPQFNQRVENAKMLSCQMLLESRCIEHTHLPAMRHLLSDQT